MVIDDYPNCQCEDPKHAIRAWWDFEVIDEVSVHGTGLEDWEGMLADGDSDDDPTRPDGEDFDQCFEYFHLFNCA